MRRGPVELAVRAFVTDLGELSLQRAVLAAEAVRVATLLDRTVDGSKASALSRELRQVVTSLSVGVSSRSDRVQYLYDEVARKRRQRRAADSG